MNIIQKSNLIFEDTPLHANMEHTTDLLSESQTIFVHIHFSEMSETLLPGEVEVGVRRCEPLEGMPYVAH